MATARDRGTAVPSPRDLAAPCPDCGRPVLRTDRATLDVEPDVLGTYWTDGTPMRGGEWRECWNAERPVGRRVHLCGIGQRVGGAA